MEYTEYMALKRALEEDFQKKLEALNLVYSLSKELGSQPRLPGTDGSTSSGPNGSSASPGTTARNGVSERGPESEANLEPFVLKEAVREVARDVPEGRVFSQRYVTTTLRRKHRDRSIHPGSVSSTLKRLVKEGEVEVAKPALGGSNPAYYQWVREGDSKSEEDSVPE